MRGGVLVPPAGQAPPPLDASANIATHIDIAQGRMKLNGKVFEAEPEFDDLADGADAEAQTESEPSASGG